MPCGPQIIHENACIEAGITLTANVTLGTVQTFCIGNPVFGECPGDLESPTCTFDVHQEVCVRIPVTFNATAAVTEQEITCNTTGIGECPEIIFGCTHTIGFFASRQHFDVTLALIAAAGGSILLGAIDPVTHLPLGLSIIADAGNAEAILSLNPPPPAPANPPLRTQYANLYAQLLAANLNRLAGANCAFADAAITTANHFIATSPPGGTTGAPDFQTPLERFNSGNAQDEGCPGHCGDEDDDNG